MKKSVCLMGMLCALLGGCKTVKDDVKSEVIALKNPEREREAEDLLAQAMDFEAAGDQQSADKTYEVLCKTYRETDIAPVAFYAWGQLLYATGHPERAFEQFKFVTKNYPFYERYDEVMEDAFSVACELMEKFNREKESASAIRRFFKSPKEAIECFQHVVDRMPQSDYAPRSLFYIAELWVGDDKQVKAIEVLDQLIEKYPESRWTPEAYVYQGDIYLSLVQNAHKDQGMTKKAIRCYKMYLALFEQREDLKDLTKAAQEGLADSTNLFAESRVALGDFYLFRRHYPDGATVFYREAIQFAPNSQAAELANARLDFIASGQPTPTNWADKLFGKVAYQPVELNEQTEAIESVEPSIDRSNADQLDALPDDSMEPDASVDTLADEPIE